ncbi:cytochrome P450 [Boletus edulis BED1]|uniref:Cytochrome P450 n=1 Tax=Boletus edulis BED1 TaxID=1328754 RepID=A0AAD4G5U8_BOLED|nr:cytochrome P450 [Boletus edulis BED1]
MTNLWFAWRVLAREFSDINHLPLPRSMAHNEFKYPKPFEFIPERFLHSDGTLTSDNVQNIAFGFGRRSCVGRAFADVSMWYAVATILALWRMSFPKDELGNDVPMRAKWASGMTDVSASVSLSL